MTIDTRNYLRIHDSATWWLLLLRPSPLTECQSTWAETRGTMMSTSVWDGWSVSGMGAYSVNYFPKNPSSKAGLGKLVQSWPTINFSQSCPILVYLGYWHKSTLPGYYAPMVDGGGGRCLECSLHDVSGSTEASFHGWGLRWGRLVTSRPAVSSDWTDMKNHKVAPFIMIVTRSTSSTLPAPALHHLASQISADAASYFDTLLLLRSGKVVSDILERPVSNQSIC